MPASKHSPKWIIFFFLTGVLIGGSWLLTHSTFFLQNPDLFSLLITFALVIFLPLLYFILDYKRKLARPFAVVFFEIGMIIARLILPNSYHSYLQIAAKLSVPLEIFGIGYFLWRIRIILKRMKENKIEYIDFMEVLRKTLQEALGDSKITDVFVTEISTIYYGLFAWRIKPDARTNVKSFTFHKKSNYLMILGVMVFLILIETIGAHILISIWNPIVAWVITAFSLYAILFLFADFNALRKRLTFITQDTLYLRVGARWTAIIPLVEIKNIELTNEDIEEHPNFLKASLIGGHNVVINLKKTFPALGYYGKKKTFNKVSLTLDDPKDFQNALESL